MENSTVSGLRSRSRSKTPFLRSSCDREGCTEGEGHSHKSGRKTPVKRSTPIKQLKKLSSSGKDTPEPIIEVDEVDNVSPPLAHRTRKSVRTTTEKLVKTSDYSSGDSPDRGQNQQNYQCEYERVSTSKRGSATGSLADVCLSPIYATYNASGSRSSRIGSPTYSACSSDSSFAEQALADVTQLREADPSPDHLPYRLYKSAGEYWNKYPKTDYTYSLLSRDRVELAPGQVAVPNMSRRSLANFRLHGASEMQESAAYTSRAYETARKRITSIDSSDDESWRSNGLRYTPISEHWWITSLLISIITTVTTTVTEAGSTVAGAAARLYRKAVPAQRHQYPAERAKPVPGLASRAGTAAAAPFVWIYTVIKKVVITTVTTVTETMSAPNHVTSSSGIARLGATKRRRWWPWLLLLLLPLLGYGSHYTYENYEHLALPNFNDFHLDLSEFTTIELLKLSLPSLPNITMPELPQINLTLPAIRENLPELPEMSKTYYEYKDIVENQVADASDYMKVVAESCFEELRRYWSGIIG